MRVHVHVYMHVTHTYIPCITFVSAENEKAENENEMLLLVARSGPFVANQNEIYTYILCITFVAAENENEMLKRKLKTMSGQLESLTTALHRAQTDVSDAQNKQV